MNKNAAGKNIQSTLKEYSFESVSSKDDLSNTLVSDEEDDTFDFENVIAENDICKRRRFIWQASYWNSMDEALAFLAAEGFTKYDEKDLDLGVKIYFRCKNVPKRSKIWCEKRYNIFLPAESNEIILQDNLEEHNHEQIISKNQSQLTQEMIQFMFTLYHDRTTSYESVIRHINRARSTQNIFINEKNPTYRQHEYRLKQHRDSNLKPVVSVGDIAEFCEANMRFPGNPDDPFVLSYVTSDISENLYFRFCITTPFLLEKFTNVRLMCIDATYKLNWNGYPLIVLGTVDRTKRFHPLLYACTSNETSNDYAFVFQSVKDGVKNFFRVSIDPKILVSDAAKAIQNGFFEVFPNAELNIMCFAHVIRNVRKRPFTSQQNKQLILADIRFMQLAPFRVTFDMMSDLFITKWADIKPNFVEYFQNEWLGGHSNWLEGAAIYAPSTNNALESHNANIKRNFTLRKRLPLNQFFISMNEMVVSASKKLSTGDQCITSEPTLTKNMLSKGVELEVNGLTLFKAKFEEQKRIPIYVVPSETCENPNKAHYKYLAKKQWTTFDEFIEEGFNKFYIIHLSQKDWKSSSKCSCPCFFKQNMCKHVIALAVRRKLFEVPKTLNRKMLTNQKKKPGRPKGAAKALIVQ